MEKLIELSESNEPNSDGDSNKATSDPTTSYTTENREKNVRKYLNNLHDEVIQIVSGNNNSERRSSASVGTDSNPIFSQDNAQLCEEIRKQILLLREHERELGESEARVVRNDSMIKFGNRLSGKDIVGLRLFVELIPVFAGRNISIQTFARKCSFAIQRIGEELHPLFVKLIRSKIQGEANLCIRSRHFETLGDLLEVLEKAFGAPKTPFQLE